MKMFITLIEQRRSQAYSVCASSLGCVYSTCAGGCFCIKSYVNKAVKDERQNIKFGRCSVTDKVYWRGHLIRSSNWPVSISPSVRRAYLPCPGWAALVLLPGPIHAPPVRLLALAMDNSLYLMCLHKVQKCCTAAHHLIPRLKINIWFHFSSQTVQSRCPAYFISG